MSLALGKKSKLTGASSLLHKASDPQTSKKGQEKPRKTTLDEELEVGSQN